MKRLTALALLAISMSLTLQLTPVLAGGGPKNSGNNAGASGQARTFHPSANNSVKLNTLKLSDSVKQPGPVFSTQTNAGKYGSKLSDAARNTGVVFGQSSSSSPARPTAKKLKYGDKLSDAFQKTDPIFKPIPIDPGKGGAGGGAGGMGGGKGPVKDCDHDCHHNNWCNWGFGFGYPFPVVTYPWVGNGVYCETVIQPVPVLQPAAVVAATYEPIVQPLAAVAVARELDLEVLEVRQLDGGDTTQGPAFRVTIRNASATDVAQAFDVVLAASISRQLSAEVPHAGVRVNGLKAGQSLPADVRLPQEAYNMGRNAAGESVAFTWLTAVIDGRQEVQDARRDNNLLMLNRADIAMVEMAIRAR